MEQQVHVFSQFDSKMKAVTVGHLAVEDTVAYHSAREHPGRENFPQLTLKISCPR